jgi:serine/threonine protein kinase
MHGVCVVPPSLCIILERCELGSLQCYLQEKGSRLCVADRIGLVMDCCSAVDFLHSRARPIVHGDIKSPNFMIKAAESGRGVAKLIDLETAITSTQRQRPDCPIWLAPEVIEGNQPTVFSDVYSLSIVIWEILSGGTPFEGIAEVRSDLAQLIVDGLRPPIRPSFPPLLTRALIDAWFRGPTGRPSAAHLTDAVKMTQLMADA